jgi:periplasmic copper chaperone A
MKRTIALSSAALGAGVLLALAAPLSASAHVSVSASSTAAGSYSVLTFSVGHGCDGSPTTTVAISLPESIVTATPTVNPNWTITKVTEPLDEPIAEDDGDSITERVSQIVYTAITPLAADQRDTFALSLALVGNEGDVLEFPTLQTCEVGETNWAGEEVPAVTLTAAVEGDDHHGGATEGDHAEADHADAAHDEAPAGDDVLARVLGIAGLVVGAVGIVIGVTGRRRSA